MNILIIGPGIDEKRFGQYFISLAKKDLHHVYEFSFRSNEETIENIRLKFADKISTIDKIDLLLYNSFHPGNPSQPEDYNINHKINYDECIGGYVTNCLMPYVFCIEALSKMDEQSKVVFMTTTGSFSPSLKYSKYSGYFGTKAAQNHLMWGFSDFNDKGVTFCSMSPHFPYEDEQTVKMVMDEAYKKIININTKDSGQIFLCVPEPAGTLRKKVTVKKVDGLRK